MSVFAIVDGTYNAKTHVVTVRQLQKFCQALGVRSGALCFYLPVAYRMALCVSSGWLIILWSVNGNEYYTYVHYERQTHSQIE